MLKPSLALLCVVVLLAGCEEIVPPTLNTGQPFTMWGALDPRTDTQAVRIVPIQLQIDANQTGPLDAEVVATNLDTGERTEWGDSVVTFSDGSAGDVFVAAFRPVYGEAYEIVATRSDGASSTARLVVPPLAAPVLLQPEFRTSEVDQRVLWPEAPRLNEVEMDFRTRDGDCTDATVTLSAADYAEPFEFGWQVTLPYDEVYDRLAAELGASRIALFRVTVRALVTDARWKPPFGFGFDDDLVIQPGSVSNVDNGFGFVGASYPSELSWSPDAEVLRIAGFVDPANINCR